MDLNTVEEIVAPAGRGDLAQFGAGDTWLAGGSALFAEPNPHLRRLFDLTAFAWPAFTPTADGGLEIAATCTLAQLSEITTSPSPAPPRSPSLAPPRPPSPAAAHDKTPDHRATTAPSLPLTNHWPALHLARTCCESLRGGFKVWNVGTVGGNMCAALPAGPMTSLTAGLDGDCTIWTPDGGERHIAVPDLVIGDGRTSLAPGELLRSITLPGTALRSRAAMRQASLLPLGRSAALIIGRVDEDDRFHLTITASVERAVRLTFPALPPADDLTAAIDDRLALADYFDDVHGAPAWRQHLTRLLAEQIRTELDDRTVAR